MSCARGAISSGACSQMTRAAAGRGWARGSGAVTCLLERLLERRRIFPSIRRGRLTRRRGRRVAELAAFLKSQAMLRAGGGERGGGSRPRSAAVR